MNQNPIITTHQIESLMALVVNLKNLSAESEAKRLEYVTNGNGSSFEVKSGFLLAHIQYYSDILKYLLESIDGNEA